MGSGSADGGVSRAAALGFPKGWVRGQGAIRARGRDLRFRVSAFRRAVYRGGGRRRDHGATTGRGILPVRAAG